MKNIIKIISIICLIIIFAMLATILYALITRNGNLAMGAIMSLMLFSIMVWVILVVGRKVGYVSKDEKNENS